MFTTSSFVRLSGVQCSPIILYSVHVDQPYAAFTMNIYLSLHGSLVSDMSRIANADFNKL